MRRLRLYIATSLDGKIARKDDSIDWLPDPQEEDYGYKEFYDSIDTVIMGYKTYEVCLTFGDWVYSGKECYVFSRNQDKKVIPEATLVKADPVKFVEELKDKDGKDIWLVGGGEIITLLHDAQLIDEYIIAFIPVILGEGIELFPNLKKEQKLNLTHNKFYENGVILTYFEKL